MNDDRYRRKRDFKRTPEPTGGRRRSGETPMFVIQEHDASTHHFDFRLELDGVLKSWAVPKGPSTDPREKRLAIATEDHPLDYADFEGVIPAGEYGAGTVIVWDRGRYDNITRKNGKLRSVKGALADGHLLICLHGEKLKGGYALQRMGDDDDNGQWLLIKIDDDDADARRNPVSTEPQSVISGDSIKSLAKKAQP